ncbi:MAG TPA: segregation/condensation protein A [bacterium]
MKLPRFDGPLDLLLFLVTKQEYDILDLPISEITDSYLGVIDSIGVENLEDAGEYLLMAATLISIKAKMLLPRPQIDGAKDEMDDPRHELAQRLLLYQKTKEESADLARREAEMAERFEMGRPAVPPAVEPEPEEYLMQMTLYDLTCAIEDIMKRKEEKRYHQVRLDKVTLDERIRWVLDLLANKERFGFVGCLQSEMERMIWVVTFLAVLEMTKRQRIRVEQNELFSEIYVSRAEVPELQAA